MSAANATAVKPSGIKIHSTNNLCTYFINGKPNFVNIQNLPRNPLDCSVLESSVFDNFVVANKLFAKALQSFRTSLAVSYSQQEN